MTEPLCAVCGEDHDYDDHKSGSELRHKFDPEVAVSPIIPRDEATRLADDAMGVGSGIKFMERWHRVRAALRKLVDEREAWARRWREGAGQGVAAIVRAEAAEADAKLAWRRVTELQQRGTELVLERRAHEMRLADCVMRVRMRLRDNGPSYVYEVLEEYERPYRPPHEEMLDHPAVKLDGLLLDLDAWRQKWSTHESASELASIVAKYEDAQ